MVAYKGGHIERDLLSQLDIPCVNVEEYGCPKVDDLVHLGFGYPLWPTSDHRRLSLHHHGMPDSQGVVTFKKTETEDTRNLNS